MSPRAATCAAAAALALLAGCGDPDLWARWQAERAYFHARHAFERVRVAPGLARPEEWRAAERAFARIPERWPARVWIERARRGGAARDVAVVAGRAAVAAARVADLGGRLDEALAGWARAESEWGALPAVALEASVARARALERAHREDEALAAWIRVASFPMLDPADAATQPAVLDAPLEVASALATQGREAEADSVLDDATGRYRAALARLAGRPGSSEVRLRLSDARASRGDIDGALDALRAVLADPAAAAFRPRSLLGLAQRSLEFGRPDSARLYAAWAADAGGGTAGAPALLLTARAWQASGPPDSALAAWDRVAERLSDRPDAAAEARYRRGQVLEATGRWEQARSEWRALAAAMPGHPFGLEALVGIADHHMRRGEVELGRFEARRAVENLEHLVATQHDPDVSFAALRARARLVGFLGDPAATARALAEVWRAAPERIEAARAGLEAARLADGTAGGHGLARELYTELAERAAAGEVRREARAALAARRGTDTR